MDNIIGTSADNILIGTSSSNLVNGKAGNDYLDGGAGSDGLIAGAGDDVLVYDAIDWKIDGGTGFDTLLFKGTNQQLDLRCNNIVSNIEQMWLYGGGGHQIWFNAADISRVSDNNKMVIRGDASDIIHPGSGWTFNSVGTDGLSMFSNGCVSFKADLNVRVEGFSNNATITLPTPLTVTEDLNVSSGNLNKTGTVTVSDPNANQALMQSHVDSVGSTIGHLTFTPTLANSLLSQGGFVYTVDNNLQAVQELGAGQSLVDSFSIHALDGTSKTISFTVLGTNDVAQIGNLAANTVTEDSAADMLALSGTLSITDVDKNEAHFKTTVANHLDGGGNNLNWGSLTIDASGNYHYSVNNHDARVQQLGAYNAADASTFHVDSFTVQSVDGTSKTISFNVLGTNDAAQIGDLATNTVTEDSAADTLALSGTLSITDVDNNEAQFKTTVANHLDGGGNNLNWGSLTIDANGNYHYSVNNQDARVQQLGAYNASDASTFHEDAFTVQSLDGTQKTLTFSIHGVDEPVTGTLELNNHSANVHELVVLHNFVEQQTRTGTALFSMPDFSIGHSITVTAQGSDYRGDFTAAFTGETIDGKEVVAWTYTVTDAALDSFDYSATAAANQTYSIQVQSNDPVNPQTLASASVDIHLFGEDEVTFGPSTSSGTSADDLINFSSSQLSASGGDGNDRIFANNLANVINGDAGDDVIFGLKGNDQINGGTGKNIIYAGSDNDTIRDGGSFTQLFGEGGDDIFILNSQDSGSSFAWGGAGADTFKTFVSNSNTDTVSKWVMDFNHAEGDTIEVAFATSSAATYHIESAVADQNNPFLSEGTHYFQVMYTETPGHDQVLLNIVASTDNPLTLTPAALHYEIS